MIIYRGPSEIDGSPIVVICTGIKSKSTNSKTGAMVQTYILRADMAPIVASRTGADSSICGACRHKGTAQPDKAKGQAKGRSCYVTLMHGPSRVFDAFERGVYGDATAPCDAVAIGRGRQVRLGTYGDPAAVPAAVWRSLISEAEGWTGYTHQRNAMPDVLMTSADTVGQARLAWLRGERTFRVLASVDEIAAGELLCPASEEAGRRTQCERCGLCAGTGGKRCRKSIAIVAHGNGKVNFQA